MERYLVLLIRKMYFFEFVDDDSICLLYNDSNKVERFIRKVVSRVCPRFLSVFFGRWKDDLKNTDTIILMDSAYNTYISKFIKSKNPNIKIVFYYWNVINNNNCFVLKDSNIDEIWTFDEKDAKVYNLKYSPQFYKKIKLPFDTLKSDVIYLGAAKDREIIIKEVEELLEKHGVSTNIIISHQGDKLKSYGEYLQMISSGKAILDIVGPSQNGMTLRCLEALFFEKKLITNNKNIKKYPFYYPDNIFIVGEDNINEIMAFLNKTYHKVEDNIINEYSYEKWLKNLIDGD